MNHADTIARKVLMNYAPVYYADCLAHPDAEKRKERIFADAAKLIEPELLELIRETAQATREGMTVNPT
jgi:hypothetical protein